MKKFIVPFIFITFFLLLTFSWSVAEEQPAKKPARLFAPDFPPFLKEMLDLTPEQESQLREFSKARLEERRTFRDKMMKMRSELREMMKDPKADEKKIEGLVDEIFKLRANQFKGSLKSRNEIKKIFTPNQLEKIEKFKTRFAGRWAMRPGRFPQWRFLPRGQFYGAERFSGPWGRGFGFRGRGLRDRMPWWL